MLDTGRPVCPWSTSTTETLRRHSLGDHPTAPSSRETGGELGSKARCAATAGGAGSSQEPGTPPSAPSGSLQPPLLSPQRAHRGHERAGSLKERATPGKVLERAPSGCLSEGDLSPIIPLAARRTIGAMKPSCPASRSGSSQGAGCRSGKGAGKGAEKSAEVWIQSWVERWRLSPKKTHTDRRQTGGRLPRRSPLSKACSSSDVSRSFPNGGSEDKGCRSMKEEPSRNLPCSPLSTLGSQLARSASRTTVLPAVLLFRDFVMEEVIGQGRHSTVRRCMNRRTGKVSACKQVDKAHMGMLCRELHCFSTVQGHRNILKLEQVYESSTSAYILTEFCEGGDLFDVIFTRGPLTEPNARELLCQLAEALRWCHARGVLHRDVKPENVLLQWCLVTRQPVIKLTDFGLSTVLQEGEIEQGWVGSQPYEAPEVVSLLPYSFPADVFSLGVVLFGMLSGSWPAFFDGQLFCPETNFSEPAWSEVSYEAMSLLTQMLFTDPDKRPSVADVGRHPWLLAYHFEHMSCAAAEMESVTDTFDEARMLDSV